MLSTGQRVADAGGDERVSGAEILTNALRNSPPTNAREALDRIAEARSIKSSAYLAAIVHAIGDSADPAAPDARDKLKPHYVTLSLCESLIDAVATLETHSGDLRIDPRLVAWLCQAAAARQWLLDPAVLHGAAAYLANASYRGFCHAVSRASQSPTRGPTTSSHGATLRLDPALVADSQTSQQFHTSVLDAVAIPAAELVSIAGSLQGSERDVWSAADRMLNVSLEVAHALVDRGVVQSRSLLFLHLVRALSAHERVADAERIFTMAKGANAKHMGAIAAAMMSMYYRRDEPAKAEAVFAAFLAAWTRTWEGMAPLPVMPDRPSYEAEKWRLTHEENVPDAGSKILLADELRRVCSNASAPFFRRALELVRGRRADEAAAFLGDVRHARHIALSRAQLDALVRALLASRCVDHAYELCMGYHRDENAAGGPGVVAQRVAFGAALSGAALSSVIAELGAADDWSRIWSVVDGARDGARHCECIGVMKTLLARALAGGDIRQAIRCAQQIVAIAGCDSRVVESLPDEWIGAVLRQAATLGLPGVAKQKPLAGLAVALLHTDVSLQNAALREWNARVEMCTDAVFAEVAVPNADEIRADIKTAARHGRFAVRSEQVQPMAAAPGRAPRPRTTAAAATATAAADIRQPGKVGNWIASDGGTEIKRGASLDQLERWYGDYRARGEIPPRAALSKMIIGAIRHGARKLWEPIVRDHMPEYLARLDDDRASQGYSQLIWSHAIYGYASLGEVEEAMAYFWRLVDAKSYPTANGTAALLGCLLAPAHPLPVIPRGWDGPAYPVRNMKPAYPPRGESPSDRFIVPKSDADRQRLVAETGLAMLYASLRHGIWPTQYFYCVLLSALSLARMVGDLRHVFATVIPTTVRKMPPHFRINQVFLQSPLAWSIAIQGAAASGERALAEHWFKEYRMSAMPLFREPSSAYSRFTDRGLPAYARLFLLAQPYYTIPKLRRLPALADGTAPPESWYDLQEVETQLQMDRLRALDKLPLPFSGAYRMLLIYAGVDEHRNMDSAEAVAGEIEALSQDKLLPRGVVPRGRLELARCWKQVVMGYVAVFQQQRADLALTCAPQSDIRRTQERIVHWYQRWSADFERSGACAGNRTAGNAALGADVVRLARELRQGLSASQ